MTNTTDAIENGVAKLVSLQSDRGFWEGEVVWCPMILAQYVIARTILRRPFDAGEIARIRRHFDVTRTPEGGWGLHPESGPYVYVTTLAYVALRLLDSGSGDPLVEPARRWLLHQKGGVLAIPTWGKFWLAMIGLYGWDGVNPCGPEMFLLPEWLPFHPVHFYCHTRYIYLGIAYLYGSRFRADLGPTIDQLRQELYQDPFDGIDFAAQRHQLAETDVYVRPTAALRAAYDVLRFTERLIPRVLRRRALDFTFQRILYEQRASRYQAISPVNGLLNTLAIWSRDPHHPDLEPSVRGIDAWKWEDDERGLRIAGARSQTWDTAFAVQAILETPEPPAPALRRAYDFLRAAQMVEDLPDWRAEHRDRALGGWCFSDGVHRWPVSDCTAEALCAVLRLHRHPEVLGDAKRIPDEHLQQAAQFILSRQNDDGGFGTYERRRGPRFLESVNPSEMFGNCMTESSYIECTGSSVRALCEFRDAHPALAGAGVNIAIDRGVRFLRARQRADGSYPGFWGINFTYAAFFVVEALRAAGPSPHDPALVRLARWLESKQRSDGGWGEHWSGCLRDEYVEHSESQSVMTAWAVLALSEVVGSEAESVQRGAAWLRSRQNPDGSWPDQAVNGVFFGAAMLDYKLYKIYFPLWAMARAVRVTD
jgi:lanosterol synthase